MVRIIYFSLFILTFLACKKAEERRCWKLVGAQTQREIKLDSVQKMILHAGVKYVMHQSENRKVEVVGGENMVNLVEVKTNNYQLEISNLSYCNFLRDFDKKVVVHVYYPRFEDIYAEISDSLIFKGTITGELLQLEMREAGGIATITTNVNDLRVIVSAGPGHFLVNGYAKYATLKTQGQGFGNALDLESKYLFGYQNSGATLKLNLNNTEAEILIDGAGNVLYTGEPKKLNLTRNGDGEFIKI